jgi:hypothetical protein
MRDEQTLYPKCQIKGLQSVLQHQEEVKAILLNKESKFYFCKN